MLIGARLAQANISIQAHDEARNFLALVAYRSYAESGSACLSRAAFEERLAHFEEQFLSSKAALRKMAVGLFLLRTKTFTNSMRSTFGTFSAHATPSNRFRFRTRRNTWSSCVIAQLIISAEVR